MPAAFNADVIGEETFFQIVEAAIRRHWPREKCPPTIEICDVQRVRTFSMTDVK
jgi:hypothetical protein